ncbi:hypothetical protein E2C01_097692 [Portunus trituberculatus]|uniref:Uncharacterized protein n=1 Tax=Portunus trituberculatus TaxID=210409 RepID=A0A5B7K119_PORTR|nr:hypothetical protein [Portunus trituberculatus]
MFGKGWMVSPSPWWRWQDF